MWITLETCIFVCKFPCETHKITCGKRVFLCVFLNLISFKSHVFLNLNCFLNLSLESERSRLSITTVGVILCYEGKSHVPVHPSPMYFQTIIQTF